MNKKELEAFASLEKMDREATLIGHIDAVLGYDFETVMSKKGGEERGKQMAYLSSLMHNIVAGPKMKEVLDVLSDVQNADSGVSSGDVATDDHVATDEQKALIRVNKKLYEDESVLPMELVEALSEASNNCQNQWFEARKSGVYKTFAPYLEKLVGLIKESAQLSSKGRSLYDTLLYKYDMGFDSAQISHLFDGMEKTIKAVMEQVDASPKKVSEKDEAFLYEKYDIEKQKAFSKQVLTDMGFEFDRGAIGVVAHPFTSTVGVDDIRITTRFEDPNVTSQLFTIVHEGGHAIYEMGACSGWIKGTSLGQGVNMAFHESQSRLWENLVARSPEFWEHYFPLFKDYFPAQTRGVELESFLRAINRVKADDVRVNADEVTYGLHIILRFRLEKELFDGNLTVADLPDAWNEMSLKLLGKKPDNMQSGVLQDVHWPSGMFGYFPSYALGNLINSHVWNYMQKDLDVASIMRSGHLYEIKNYLTDKYYKFGAIYPANDLIKKVTGQELDASYFDVYLKDKYKALF
jgi:carboxypeptidase Taq